MSTQTKAYTNLIGLAPQDAGCGALVVPGDASVSLLYLKVTGTQPAGCGEQMPLFGTPLTPGDVGKVRGWIDRGAPND